MDLVAVSTLPEQVRGWSHGRRDRVANAIGDLVRVPSHSPHETDLHAHLTALFTEAGCSVAELAAHDQLTAHTDYTVPFLPGGYQPRPTLHAHKAIASDLPTLVLSAHTDVIPALGHHEPWSGRYDGHKVHGRGSADTKNNIVMLAEALTCIEQLGLTARGNIRVDLVPDEEAGGNGALSAILHHPVAAEVIVLEPTSLQVHHGHRGCLSFTLTANAPAKHMGSAGSHMNAIEACLHAAARLRELESRWLAEAADCDSFRTVPQPLQLNLSAIHADGWHGAAPRTCAMSASLGFLPHHSIGEARDLIHDAIRCGDPQNLLNISWHGIHNGAYIGKASGACAVRLRDSLTVSGGPRQHAKPWHVSCDARLYAQHSLADTVVFGSGDLDQAHTDHESVEVDQVLIGTAALVDYLCAPIGLHDNYPDRSHDGAALGHM